MPRVTVMIVSWNSARDLPDCLGALRQQVFIDFAVQVVDNASTDASVGVARRHFPRAHITVNGENVGFCRAVNQGLALAASEFVLVLNADVTLAPECLAELVLFAATHPAAGSVGPKLLRRNAGSREVSAIAFAAPPIIDGAGLQMGRRRVCANRGEGERDIGQYQQPAPVFGCSGACVLYRLQALQAIAVEGEIFDHDFFAYKDDVDVAWRLQLAGYEAWYTPSAVAYHVRRVRRSRASWSGRIRQRRMIPPALRSQSLKNQYLMLVKNESGENFVRDLLPIFGHAILLLLVSLMWEPFLWRALPPFVQQLPAAWRKRRIIQAQAKIKASDMRRWFTAGNSRHQIPNKSQ